VSQPVPSYSEPDPARPADVHALVIGQADPIPTHPAAFR
jgi:hypothetical protein